MNKKIAVIGAGNVGGILRRLSGRSQFADIVMIDIAEGIPQGKGLDLTQAGPVRVTTVRVTGSNDYKDIARGRHHRHDRRSCSQAGHDPRGPADEERRDRRHGR